MDKHNKDHKKNKDEKKTVNKNPQHRPEKAKDENVKSKKA